MKKIFLGTLIMVFAMSGLSLYAAPSGEKGASAKAYEHASDQSVFNRTSDWFFDDRQIGRGKGPDQEREDGLARSQTGREGSQEKAKRG